MALRVLSFDVGTKNLAACDLDVHADGSFKVNAWTVESCVARGVNVNKTPVHELAPTFYNFVKKRAKSWFYTDGASKNIARVFIENQPLGGRGAARNLKTKILSHILQCIIAEIVPEVPISFVHPGLKLKDMPRTDGVRPSYRDNKLYAIAKTTEYVEGPSCTNVDDCKTMYVERKMKKDDLADAFLQGLIAGGMYARGDVVEAPSDDRPKKAKKPVDPNAPAGEKKPFGGRKRKVSEVVPAASADAEAAAVPAVVEPVVAAPVGPVADTVPSEDRPKKKSKIRDTVAAEAAIVVDAPAAAGAAPAGESSPKKRKTKA